VYLDLKLFVVARYSTPAPGLVFSGATGMVAIEPPVSEMSEVVVVVGTKCYY